MLHFLALAPRGGSLDGIAARVAKDKSSTGREELWKIWIIENLLRKRCGTATNILFAVRRISDNEIKHLSRRDKLWEHGKNILRANFKRAWRYSRSSRIAPDEFRVLVRKLNTHR